METGSIVRGCVATTALLIACVTGVAGQGIEAGGGLGYVFDTSDDFIALTGEARIELPESNASVVPRLTYYLESGATRIQIDGNVIRELPLEGDGRAVPYVGVGIAIESISFDTGESPGVDGSDTNVGINLVAGARVRRDSSVTPFAQFQYTAIRDQGNTAVITVGGLWRVRGS